MRTTSRILPAILSFSITGCSNGFLSGSHSVTNKAGTSKYVANNNQETSGSRSFDSQGTNVTRIPSPSYNLLPPSQAIKASVYPSTLRIGDQFTVSGDVFLKDVQETVDILLNVSNYLINAPLVLPDKPQYDTVVIGRAPVTKGKFSVSLNLEDHYRSGETVISVDPSQSYPNGAKAFRILVRATNASGENLMTVGAGSRILLQD